jgi:hypothetical protein
LLGAETVKNLAIIAADVRRRKEETRLNCGAAQASNGADMKFSRVVMDILRRASTFEGLEALRSSVEVTGVECRDAGGYFPGAASGKAVAEETRNTGTSANVENDAHNCSKFLKVLERTKKN